ncbi:ATPase [Clostridium sp. JN-1]|jgi:cell division septum initiation protein DivIVA|uniref:ATPase n=1 Tax=Clostridium sp. JN-1 TaxID=2483110 RepID=UPI000F0B4B7F|nr:ATPase [Clostridium sp. JN-1]
MDVIKLLEYLHEVLETSSKVPMTGKVILDKNETLEIVEKIINYLPDELKKAQWIVEEKERILSDSIQEAENLKKENLIFLRKQVENHDITMEANARAEEIIKSAQKSAKSITLGARDYADGILNELDNEINEKKKQLLLNLKSELQSFLVELDSSVKLKTDVIRQNVKELRNMK